MYSNKIQIFCDGGFGNRLNTLLSGLAIAQLFGLDATIYWPRNNWCQAGFTDLFAADLTISEQSLTDLSGSLGSTLVLLHDQIGADTLRVPFHSAYGYTSTEDFAVKALASGKDIFYYPALIPPWLPIALVAKAIPSCRFQTHIVEAVTTFVGKTIGKPFHGLHLRRTDLNVGYTDAEVQDIVRQHPDETFFVCSDDPVAQAMAAAHPHVFQRSKSAYVDKRKSNEDWSSLTADDDGRLYHSNIDRNAKSVIEAVIDMLILAHSSIVGFSGSTFQNMARLYGTHAPMVDLPKPKTEISYLSVNTATRMIQAGAMPLGDALSQAVTLYNSNRKADAITLERFAIEYGTRNGIRDANYFVLHYNLAAHLINEGAPYEALLYLEEGLKLVPNHSETIALLGIARDRSGRVSVQVVDAPSANAPTLSTRNGTIKTYMQWHLGDNLIHLHFLRKLAEKYPELEFEHAMNPSYLGQCLEVVQDIPRIKLLALEGTAPPQGLDGWKGAGGFFFSHPKKLEFGTLYLDLFAKLSKDIGLSSPFKTTEDLLFDYPAILEKQPAGRYDVVLINSKPLSDQFKSYNEKDFIDLAHSLRNKGLSVVTTYPIDGFDCTLDTQCTVTDIAALSLRAKYFIAVCTGAMWPSINAFNQDIHRFKIILNDHEIIDIGKNITMCTDSHQLKNLVLDLLSVN